MPSHPERVRRNYPEGVPAFALTQASRLYFCGVCGTHLDTWSEWQEHRQWCCFIRRFNIVAPPDAPELEYRAHGPSPTKRPSVHVPQHICFVCWRPQTLCDCHSKQRIAVHSDPSPQSCVTLGHVYGDSGRCLFCMAPKPAPDDTVTLTREELVEQLEEIASENGMTAESMARLLRRRSCQGLGSWCQNSAEFCVLAHMLPTDDPLSVDAT